MYGVTCSDPFDCLSKVTIYNPISTSFVLFNMQNVVSGTLSAGNQTQSAGEKGAYYNRPKIT